MHGQAFMDNDLWFRQSDGWLSAVLAKDLATSRGSWCVVRVRYFGINFERCFFLRLVSQAWKRGQVQSSGSLALVLL